MLYSRFIECLRERESTTHWIDVDVLAELVTLHHFGIGKVTFKWFPNFPGAQLGGFIRLPEERTSPYEEAYHDAVVYLNSNLKSEAELPLRRIVAAKELMHVFDVGEQRTDTPEKFRTLLAEIEARPVHEDASEPYESERAAFWKAIIALIPPWFRNQFHEQWTNNTIDAAYLALRWKLPEAIVAAAMGPYYDRSVTRYLNKKLDVP